MKAKVFRQILKGSHIEKDILIYDLGAFKIFERKALWATVSMADPLQTLPSEEQPIALRWLKRKGIVGWNWSQAVYNEMVRRFNAKLDEDSFDLAGVFSGEIDRYGNKIFYETSKLRLPDGRIAKLMFDYGQHCAYFGEWESGGVIEGLDGINNSNSFYLRDCEVIE